MNCRIFLQQFRLQGMATPLQQTRGVTTTLTLQTCTRAKISRARGSRSDETQMIGLQHFCACQLQFSQAACHVQDTA